MNVGLPGGGDPGGFDAVFWIIVAASIARHRGMLGFFRYKRWL